MLFPLAGVVSCPNSSDARLPLSILTAQALPPQRHWQPAPIPYGGRAATAGSAAPAASTPPSSSSSRWHQLKTSSAQQSVTETVHQPGGGIAPSYGAGSGGSPKSPCLLPSSRGSRVHAGGRQRITGRESQEKASQLATLGERGKHSKKLRWDRKKIYPGWIETQMG